MASQFSLNDSDPWSHLRGDWKWMLFFAVLLVITGILAALNPLATVLATSIMLGTVLLLTGGFSLFMGVANKGFRNRWVDIIFGILALVAAFFVFRSPIVGALSLIWTLGAVYAVSGIFELIHAFQVKTGRGWLIFPGLVDLVIGLWIMFMPPGSALVTLALIVGLGLIFRGVFLAIVAFKVKSVAG